MIGAKYSTETGDVYILYIRGRKAFYTALKRKGKPTVECVEVILLAQVTAMDVRTVHAERARVPIL